LMWFPGRLTTGVLGVDVLVEKHGIECNALLL
jgi:hypothetical protein